MSANGLPQAMLAHYGLLSGRVVIRPLNVLACAVQFIQLWIIDPSCLLALPRLQSSIVKDTVQRREICVPAPGPLENFDGGKYHR